jgi:hypothetical protein
MTIAAPAVPTMAEAFTAANPVAEQPPLSPEQAYSAGQTVRAIAPPTAFDSEMASYRARQSNPNMPAFTGAPGPDPSQKATIVPINTPLNPIVNGVGGGDRNIVETNPLMRQAQDRGTIAMVAGGNGSTGVVAGADGVMMSPDQYIRENTPAMASPFRATNAVENAANKAAYDEFQQRSKDNVLTGGSTGGMGGPTFNLRPSKEERVLGVQNAGAMALAGANNASAERRASIAGKINAEENSADRAARLKAVEITARGRVDAAGARPSRQDNAYSNGLLERWKSEKKAIDDLAGKIPANDGTPENADTIRRQSKMLREREAGLDKMWDEYNSSFGDQSIAPQTKAIPGQGESGQGSELEGTIIKNPKTGERLIKKNGTWIPAQ